jgi:D-3-phosphoglycerate dehydrogenase
MAPPFRLLCPEPENYSRAGLSALEELVDLTSETMSQREFEENARAFDGLAVRIRTRVKSDLIGEGSRVRCILSPTTGLDHIPIAEAARRGVEVFHLKGQVDVLRDVPSTAEHTWALLLSVVRKVPAAFESVCAGNWQQEPFRGNELKGKTLAVLGYGRLGRMVARYGTAFGMRVLAYDVARVEPARSVQLCNTMDELLRQASVLTIHVPLTRQTAGLIGEEQIRKLPQGAVLINTSRGDIVDQRAMLASLASGHLAGAGLDVISNEADFSSSPVLEYARGHSNVVVTPHIGGATEEAVETTDMHIFGRFREWLLSQETRQ